MTDFIARFDVINETARRGYTRAKDVYGNFLSYCYRFWGGEDDLGTVTVSKSNDGDSIIVVRFDPVTDVNYKIQNVTFWSDSNKTNNVPSGPSLQFDFKPARDGRGVTLYDRIASKNGKVPFDFCYSIEVSDNRSGQNSKVNIVCDPTIHNNTVL